MFIAFTKTAELCRAIEVGLWMSGSEPFQAAKFINRGFVIAPS
jgi:hypothetical protein